MVHPDRPQIQHGACALHAGYLRVQKLSEVVIRIAFPLLQWLHESPITVTFIRTLPALSVIVSAYADALITKFM